MSTESAWKIDSQNSYEDQEVQGTAFLKRIVHMNVLELLKMVLPLSFNVSLPKIRSYNWKLLKQKKVLFKNLRPFILQWSIWMYQDLGISVYPLVKPLVCSWRIINVNLMKNNKWRLSPPWNDQVSNSGCRIWHCTGPCLGEALLEDFSNDPNLEEYATHLLELLPKRYQYLAFFTLRVWGAGVRRHITLDSLAPQSASLP